MLPSRFKIHFVLLKLSIFFRLNYVVLFFFIRPLAGALTRTATDQLSHSHCNEQVHCHYLGDNIILKIP